MAPPPWTTYGTSLNSRCSKRLYQWNTDDADERGSSRIKLKRISVNPLYPSHPRSVDPNDVKTALV